MICPTCGTTAPDGAKFCGHCGHALLQTALPAGVPAAAPVIAPPQVSTSRSSTSPPAGIMLAIGFFGGGFIGFLMRPSVFLVGQLPFGTVVTRGSALSGIDQLLVPTAQQSFNIVMLGALVGAAGAFAVSRLLARGRA